MICPPDVLCRWLRQEERWETMEELALNLERERNQLIRLRQRLVDAKEAARIERWIKREPAVVIELEPAPPQILPAINPQTLMDTLVDEFKLRLVLGVMAAKKGNQSATAQALGVHRNTVNRIVKARNA